MIIELYKRDGELVGMVETVDDALEGNLEVLAVLELVRRAVEAADGDESFRLDVSK